MNEISIINLIETIIGREYIGDDCAYLKDIGLVVTQDSLVENIHFKKEWCSPFQLGYKSVAVNISDILASGAIPAYITIALSLPNNIDNNYIEQFYKGAKSALHGAKIVGGDITGSKNDIIISISAIGKTSERNISSRKNAKSGYIIITRGNYGSSAAGLQELVNHGNDITLIKEHLEPHIDTEFSNVIATKVNEPYAMMDTSDGLADALFKIAEASNVRINADYSKISHLSNITKEQVLFGGEDYNLIAAIPSQYSSLIKNADIIGYVSEYDGIRLNISGECFNHYSELNIYNHFS